MGTTPTKPLANKPLGEMTDAEVRELLVKMDEWLSTPPTEAEVQQLREELQRIEDEYDELERIDIEMLRKPMTI